MRRLALSALAALAAVPSRAEGPRLAAGYQLTGGSDGYAAHEGRLDGSALAFDWLGLYGGASFIGDRVFRLVWSGAAGVEFLVGYEDRFRFGVHGVEGRFRNEPGRLQTTGWEAGYLTQLGRFEHLGFFYRNSSGDLPPVPAARATMLEPGGFAVPGRRDHEKRGFVASKEGLDVHEFSTVGTLRIEEAELTIAITGILVSQIGPAAAETLAVSFPVFGGARAFAAGTLEQSSTLGSLQFGSLGFNLAFGESRLDDGGPSERDRGYDDY